MYRVRRLKRSSNTYTEGRTSVLVSGSNSRKFTSVRPSGGKTNGGSVARVAGARKAIRKAIGRVSWRGRNSRGREVADQSRRLHGLLPARAEFSERLMA